MAAFNLIYDNDMGNDIDDAFAQIMAAQWHKAGKCHFALTVSSNPNPLSVAAIKALNEYYGAGDVPLALSRKPLGDHYCQDSNRIAQAMSKDSKAPENVQEGVAALRKTLWSLPDSSVRVVATGFSCNLAGLLDSQANHDGDGIPLDGMALVAKKVQFLSIMACDFSRNHGEYNVNGDVPACRKVMESWPSPVYISDYQIGLKVTVDWARLDKQLKEANPLKRGYWNFYRVGDPNKEMGARPSWDQTSMLFALEPDGDFFTMTEEGAVEILDNGASKFHPKKGTGRRYFIFDNAHTAESVNELLHAKYYVEPS